MLLTAPERTELSETAGKEEEALRLIEQSRLFDMENFNDLLSFDTEDKGPEHGFSRKCYERSFWNIRPWIHHIRDDIIRKDVFDLHTHASEAKNANWFHRPADDDDDSRITEDQWAEMTRELLTLEKVLEETKIALQRFYRTISTTALTDSEDKEEDRDHPRKP
ncbi:hypothetical protein XPA_001020 [Xanthoria parietina]